MTRLRAVDTPLDPDRADVIVLDAPGRPGRKEHPMLGPLRVRMNWMSAVHALMRDQRMSLYEADRIATEGAFENHDGKGRRFQPAGQR